MNWATLFHVNSVEPNPHTTAFPSTHWCQHFNKSWKQVVRWVYTLTLFNSKIIFNFFTFCFNINISQYSHWGFPGSTSGKNTPANAEDIKDVGSIPGSEDPLEEGTATQSSILIWEIPWIEEPGRLQSIGLQGDGHNWSDLACVHYSQYKKRPRSLCLKVKVLHNLFPTWLSTFTSFSPSSSRTNYLSKLISQLTIPNFLKSPFFFSSTYFYLH